MEKLVFDNGVKEYEVNGHTLRFNPSDPNVYSRFVRAIDDIKSLESEYSRNAAAAKDKLDFGAYTLTQMEELDSKVKGILSSAFGRGNDFNVIFDGVNISAKNSHGERVVDAFIVAVKPIMLDGMKALFEKDEADIERYAGGYE